MAALPDLPPAWTGASLDDAVDRVLAAYRDGKRLEATTEPVRTALRERLRESGVDARAERLLEMNLLGSLTGWIEFILAEDEAGRDVVPDFARHLRAAFLAHCRQRQTDPDRAVRISVQLATEIMDLACAFRRHMNRADADAGPNG